MTLSIKVINHNIINHSINHKVINHNIITLSQYMFNLRIIYITAGTTPGGTTPAVLYVSPRPAWKRGVGFGWPLTLEVAGVS